MPLTGPFPPEIPEHISRRLLFGTVAGALHLIVRYAGSELTETATRVHSIPYDTVAAARQKIEQRALCGPVGQFVTDFTENNPLKAWDVELRGGLIIEPFGGYMSALPCGSSLLKPSSRMTDGEAVFDFTTGRNEAGFIFRAQDHKTSYVAKVRRIAAKGRPPVLTLTIWERRKGNQDRFIKSTVIRDYNLVNQYLQRLSIVMQGDTFTARLHQWKDRWRFGRTSDFEPVRVLTWKDRTFPAGPVGTWTPPVQARAQQDFRLFAVMVET